MNVSRRSFCTTLAAGLAMGMFAGTGAAFAADDKAAELKTVEQGKLIMGTNATFPPYEYYDGDKIVGIDADVAALIADKLGLELEIEDMDFGAIITAVQTGKIDMGLAGITVNDERKKNVNFTDSYTEASQVIIVKGMSTDLTGKTIGVQMGTTGMTYAEGVDGATVEKYNKGADAIEALKQGKVDVVLIDSSPAKYFVSKNPELSIAPKPFAVEKYACAIKKGNDELTQQINDALSQLRENGTLNLIEQNWLVDAEYGKHPYESPEGITYSGKLVMATNAEFPPYELKEEGEIVGFDVDMMRAVCDILGKELVIDDMAFDSVIAAVDSGKADVGVAGMTVTEDRLENVDFSDTYAHATQVVIVKEDSDIASPDDLEGKKIGVQLGTTGDIYAGDIKDATVERYNKGFEAVQALTQDKIDAVVIDGEPAKVFVKENEGLKMLDEAFTEEDYAIAVAKGNDELLDKINTALGELKDSGELDKIVDKYITAE